MKSKRSRTYLVSGLTLALIFVAIILVFRDVLPDIVKDLSTVPFWGVLLLLALGFAYEAMESVLCLVIIPPCKVGDTVWVITGTAIKLCTVDRIHILGNGQVQIRAKYFVTDNIYLYPDMFGKTVFLTCAEAEAAIEARKGGKE